MTPQADESRTPFWREIDWQRPWLAPYRADGERCAELARSADLPQALNRLAATRGIALAAGALRFVPQAQLPAGEAYEAFIHRSACVPTRDNLHDLFNALVWLRFAPLKRRLNELQAEQIARAGIGATRGAVRDALTLFDENAAWWQPPPALAETLQRRDWHGLFIGRRSGWAQAPLVVFGHALLEKLVRPRKAMTAHVCVVPPGDDAPSHILQTLTPAWLAAKPFLPLPVLGVPGWWPPNDMPGFYDDASVFRPAASSSELGMVPGHRGT